MIIKITHIKKELSQALFCWLNIVKHQLIDINK